MRALALALVAVPLLAAAPAPGPAYVRWGEVDFGGRRAIYLEDDSAQPGLVVMALCSTSSSLVEWRHYRPQTAPAMVNALERRAGPGRAIAGCDRACQLASQAIARRNALPDDALRPDTGLSWSLDKAAALAQLRARLADFDRPRAMDALTAARERARASDMVTRFERQCGGMV